MKTFRIKIKGKTPLMHHRMTEEAIMGLLQPKSKKKTVQDESRTPRDIAAQHAYANEDGTYYIPTEYLIGAFKTVASDYKQKDSQRKSYKSIVGGIFRPVEAKASLKDHSGKPIKTFEVDIKKATNHQKGAVAICRPRFDEWSVETEVQIDDTLLDEHTARQILTDAGTRSGIGSFRVARGGFYGQFSVEEFKQV